MSYLNTVFTVKLGFNRPWEALFLIFGRMQRIGDSNPEVLGPSLLLRSIKDISTWLFIDTAGFEMGDT